MALLPDSQDVAEGRQQYRKRNKKECSKGDLPGRAGLLFLYMETHFLRRKP